MSMAACGAGDNFIPLVRNSCVNNSASVIKTHHNKAKKRKMGDKNVRSVEIYGDRKLIPRMKNVCTLKLLNNEACRLFKKYLS